MLKYLGEREEHARKAESVGGSDFVPKGKGWWAGMVWAATKKQSSSSAAASLCVLDSTRRPFTNDLGALCSIPDRFFGASLTARVSGAIQILSNFPSFLPK
nr:hypothetical protein CFP56_75758 [Quercus suber]